ncbi:MAG TPA: hypothetical protein VI408_00230 [Gaiellaceae bacterium]
MKRNRMIVLAAALAATGTAAAGTSPRYTRSATEACLLRLPDAVEGLPPASPPASPVLFVHALAGERSSARAPQLAVWSGARTYDGIVLSFFATAAAARAAASSLTSPYGGLRTRNVVASWEQTRIPTIRVAVLACLRSGSGAFAAPPAPRATIATFAGRWGGHTRGLAITRDGRADEDVNDGCCTHVYRLAFRILSVRGTVTRATARYRVTAFKRFEQNIPERRPGAVGRLVLRNGILTNTLTRVSFCSDPAWAATGACGA